MPIHDPDESIGFHFDTEFVDNGVRGVALISLGAVLYFRGHTRKFYAIHRPFFSTTAFHDLLSASHGDREYENATWLCKNVFKHFDVRFEDGSVYNMREHWDMFRKFGAARRELMADSTVFIDKAGFVPDHDAEKCFVVGDMQGIRDRLCHVVNNFAGTSGNADAEVQPIAYVATTDMSLLFSVLGGSKGLNGMPDNWRYYAQDLRALQDIFGLDHEKFNPTCPHHAGLDSEIQFDLWKQMETAIRKGK